MGKKPPWPRLTWLARWGCLPMAGSSISRKDKCAGERKRRSGDGLVPTNVVLATRNGAMAEISRVRMTIFCQ